jgi:hypothetical protein
VGRCADAERDYHRLHLFLHGLRTAAVLLGNTWNRISAPRSSGISLVLDTATRRRLRSTFPLIAALAHPSMSMATQLRASPDSDLKLTICTIYRSNLREQSQGKAPEAHILLLHTVQQPPPSATRTAGRDLRYATPATRR